MIFVGGGGFGVVVLLGFLMLLVVGGGRGLVPLVFLLLFFGLPFLLIRSALRSAMRPTRLPRGGGWHTTTWPQQPVPAPPTGWQPPSQPVLPKVAAADVSSLRDRLGHDIRTLEPGADHVAQQAMADASERYSTASTLLERASSDAQLRTAWLAAVEGLQATRVVRERLGLDLGPAIPSLPSTGPQLSRPSTIDVEGRSYTGAPTYEPGRPHWFPGGSYGGRHVPGGWYDAPFWPSALVLGGLGGWALGGLLGGALAGAMYGEDLGSGDDPGSDWGGGGDWGSGGGDWGSSGGDFGGFGGGGDWGGGGDFGGGGGDFGGGGDW